MKKPLLVSLLLSFTAACDPSTPPSDAGGTSLVCSEEGAMRIAECGFCGMVSQTCSDGRWTMASACLGAGPCEPASVQTRVGPVRCTPEQRLCGADCQWGEWLAAGSPGECEPGQLIGCGDGTDTYRVCSAECRYAEVCTSG